jgi:hypothetical protein
LTEIFIGTGNAFLLNMGHFIKHLHRSGLIFTTKIKQGT